MTHVDGYRRKSNQDVSIVANFTIPVDFNNRDNDGSVRLNADGTTQFIIERGIQLAQGAVVSLSDGELNAAGVLERRGGIWVATDLKWKPY